MTRLVVEWWIHDNRRVLTTLLAGCAIALLATTHPVVRPETVLEHLLDACGWVLVAGAVAMRLWATAFVGGRKNRQLVTTGPYRLVRHPLYLGSFVGLCGILLIAERLWLLLPGGMLVGLYRYIAALEDRRLAKQFAEQAGDYHRRTCGFWPRLERLGATLQDRPGPVSGRCMAREAGCSALFVLLACLAELSEAGWW